MVYGRTDGERSASAEYVPGKNHHTDVEEARFVVCVRPYDGKAERRRGQQVHTPSPIDDILSRRARSRSMNASPLFDPQYLPIIVGTLVGFAALAALLLVPIYRFLDREEEVAEDWTPEALAERMRERQQTAANGTEAAEEREHSSEPDGSPSASP